MKKNNNLILLKNKKAYHNFEIIESFEAGIELKGTEVKSCKARNISMNDAYAKIEKGEIILYNMHINTYEGGNRFNHDPKRPRKLLLHKREILKLSQQVKEKNYTIIPLKAYLKKGKIKIEIATAKGKTNIDKRESLKKKEDLKKIRNIVKGY